MGDPLPAAPETALIASAQATNAASGGAWRNLAVSDDGRIIRVAVDGAELLAVDVPVDEGGAAMLALHQGPRSQAEYASLRVAGTAGGRENLLLDHRFDTDADQALACLAHWPRTTLHRQPDEWTLFRTTFTLGGTVRRARLYAAAHHHAQFSVAGTHCLSTTSFGYPGEGYYDAADLTELLAGHPRTRPCR
ncbi:hypothetical protein OUO20_13450 [Arthrobacter sp. FX8]|uniref:hypothetical protein n=1 Tax=Arthrobacter sp. FX8 TaxID=2997335 RepID=UPI00227A6E82|nr:hypothetical protein [Arthrobacter sp. FX8]WAJ32172.1 hypothetical protein OUO20_13450 [Arthrobacter sp. FX8]